MYALKSGAELKSVCNFIIFFVTPLDYRNSVNIYERRNKYFQTKTAIFKNG